MDCVIKQTIHNTIVVLRAKEQCDHNHPPSESVAYCSTELARLERGAPNQVFLVCSVSVIPRNTEVVLFACLVRLGHHNG